MPLHGELVDAAVQLLHGDGLGVEDEGVHGLVERVVQARLVQVVQGLCEDLQATSQLIQRVVHSLYVKADQGRQGNKLQQ